MGTPVCRGCHVTRKSIGSLTVTMVFFTVLGRKFGREPGKGSVISGVRGAGEGEELLAEL